MMGPLNAPILRVQCFTAWTHRKLSQPWDSSYWYLHFKDEEPEAQRRKDFRLMSPSWDGLRRAAPSCQLSATLETEQSAVTWKQWGGKMSCLAPSCLVGPDGAEPVSNTWPDGNRKRCRQTGSFPANGGVLTGWRGRLTLHPKGGPREGKPMTSSPGPRQ